MKKKSIFVGVPFNGRIPDRRIVWTAYWLLGENKGPIGERKLVQEISELYDFFPIIDVRAALQRHLESEDRLLELVDGKWQQLGVDAVTEMAIAREFGLLKNSG